MILRPDKYWNFITRMICHKKYFDFIIDFNDEKVGVDEKERVIEFSSKLFLIFIQSKFVFFFSQIDEYALGIYFLRIITKSHR